jgi:hypothetical protein
MTPKQVTVLAAGAAFTVSMLVWAALAWLGGYDFDKRSPLVALVALCALGVSLLTAAGAAGIVSELWHDS